MLAHCYGPGAVFSVIVSPADPTQARLQFMSLGGYEVLSRKWADITPFVGGKQGTPKEWAAELEKPTDYVGYMGVKTESNFESGDEFHFTVEPKGLDVTGTLAFDASKFSAAPKCFKY